MEIAHNGMARCGACGEPCAPVLIGTPTDIENHPLIRLRCIACSVTEEAEAITASAPDQPKET